MSSVPPAPAPASGKATPDQDAALCRTVGDLYEPSARRLIAAQLGPFFAEHHAVPLELLHAPRLQQAFDGHALRRTICTRVAKIQAEAAGVAPSTREKELEALLTAAAAETKARIKAHPPAVLSRQDYATQAAQRAKGLSGFDATFAVHAALTQTLSAAKDRSAKIDTLLELCEQAPAGPGLDAAAAQLGEHLAFKGVFRAIWNDPDELKGPIDSLIDLIVGAPAREGVAPMIVRRLHALLAADKPLDGLRAGLIEALHLELQSPDRLVARLPDDPLGQRVLLADLLATAEVARRLKRPDGFVGGHRTHDVIDRRVSLALSGDKLQEVLRGKSILEKLRDLFHLQEMVATTSSTRVIDDYILYLMEGRDFLGRLFDAVEAPEERVRALAELQMLVLTAPFAKPVRVRLAKMLDGAQQDVLKTTPIFSALRKDRPPITAVLNVVDLIGAGAFTQGKCLTEARELVRRHIRSRDFVRKYIAGTDQNFEDAEPPPVSVRVAELSERLRKAGIAFQPLTDVRVLVVDDEESARNYIEMVLREMGFENIISAGDGRSALETFQDFEDGIDLIVCDWMMPRMSGLDFLKQVRSVKPKLPFLMVTALATLETVQQAMDHDVNAYIAKPFPPEQLEEKVLLLLNRLGQTS